MKAVQRGRGNSPTDDDIERMSETIYRLYGKGIKDVTTFNKAFNSYFDVNLTPAIEQRREDVFDRMRSRSPRIEKDSIFEKAGGKRYDQDIQQTSKNLVYSKEKYIEVGARTSDLVGYDTKNAGILLSKKQGGAVFKQQGTIKNEKVFSRTCTHKVKGKTRTVLRDPKGRFVKKV